MDGGGRAAAAARRAGAHRPRRGPRPGGLADRGPAAATSPTCARRLPGAEPVLQLDEPSLPAVLAGAVRSSSGATHRRAGQGDRRRGRAERPGRRGRASRSSCTAAPPGRRSAWLAGPGRPVSRSTSRCSARTWTTSSARPSSRGCVLLAGLVPAVAGGRGVDVGGRGYGRAGTAALAAARSRPAAARRAGRRHPHLRAGRGLPGARPGRADQGPGGGPGTDRDGGAESAAKAGKAPDAPAPARRAGRAGRPGPVRLLRARPADPRRRRRTTG